MPITNLSAFAEADLKEIWIYIGEKNPVSADKLVNELLEKFQLLAKTSGLGKKRDDLLINLRIFPHKKYLIFYFPIEGGVEIYRVLHSSRDINHLFSDYFKGLSE